MKVVLKNHRGYTPFYDEKLDLVDNPKALNVNEDFFERVGAFNPPGAILRPMHYPDTDHGCTSRDLPGGGVLKDRSHHPQEPSTGTCAGKIDYSDDQCMHGCGAHTNYGMITILMTDGVHRLQAC
ncbi:hypothetical protein RND71_015812 [Anisodus tanguticus]|uniref:Uncharacterized protein n=1 Tax=Anisodus tanguticus TaxID=243964 RepID=A0AAE1S4Y5_9SOLA|nr:hypothetical protein RND71_015812 [Anisodus tanguticus]